jgi:hypothetical protein
VGLLPAGTSEQGGMTVGAPAHTTKWEGIFTVSVKSPNLFCEFPIAPIVTISILSQLSVFK